MAGMVACTLAAARNSKLSHDLLVSAIYKLYTVNASREVKWEYLHEAKMNPVILDAWVLGNGNFLFSHRYGIIEMNADRETVWEYKLEEKVPTELHSCQPLADGKFLVLECSENRLFEIDRAGNIYNEIALTGTSKGAHTRYGVARKTPEGTYLVPYVLDGKVVEFDYNGKIIREITVQDLKRNYIWYAERLSNGNTLLSTGHDRRVIEIDPDDNIVWELRESDLPGIKLFCLMGIQRLPNGNTLVCNGDFHIEELPRGEVMMFEVTFEKEVVWKLTRTEIGKTLPPMMQGQNPIYRTTQVKLISK